MPTRLNVNVRCAIDAKNALGESPVWSVREQALYWVDILSPAVHRWHPGSGARRTWPMPATVGSMGLREGGGWVLALRTGFHLFDPESGARTLLVNPEPDLGSNRLNDGKVAPDGSFWAGTMDERADKQPIASLYRLGVDHRCTRMVSGLKVSNGLAWSPDARVLYHSDSRAATIWRYAYAPGEAALGEREILAVTDPSWGRPDGGCTDVEGCYWSCGAAAGRVNRFSPQGALLSWIELPVTHPTMPCFGGPELRTLYVTSQKQGLSPEQLAITPMAGGVFEIDLDIAGVPVDVYRG